jgi:hypothetical protein
LTVGGFASGEKTQKPSPVSRVIITQGGRSWAISKKTGSRNLLQTECEKCSSNNAMIGNANPKADGATPKADRNVKAKEAAFDGSTRSD